MAECTFLSGPGTLKGRKGASLMPLPHEHWTEVVFLGSHLGKAP